MWVLTLKAVSLSLQRQTRPARLLTSLPMSRYIVIHVQEDLNTTPTIEMPVKGSAYKFCGPIYFDSLQKTVCLNGENCAYKALMDLVVYSILYVQE